MPSHFGFGSATAIRLAALEGASVIAGQPAARESLVRGSKRGGTSGIGITTYFTGGFVLDLGVKQAPLEILPSSALEGARPDPLVIMRIDMPDWGVGICIPSGIRALSEVEEIEFFRRACPVPRPDVNETLYHVIYGLAASALERDLGTFSQAIKEIQGCTWKSLERVLHGDRLLALERDIYEAGAAAVGMSSLGPCLFFLGGDLGRLADSLSEKRPEHLWLTTAICNSSRSLTAA